MRHKINIRKLGRTASHRKAMFSNMASSLLKHEKIETTLAKAKELRRYVEPLITRARENTLHNKREILKKLGDRRVVVKLFDNISLRYSNRPGGYTRIIRLSKRRVGDNSKMALIELVEESLTPKKKKSPITKEENSKVFIKNEDKTNKQKDRAGSKTTINK